MANLKVRLKRFWMRTGQRSMIGRSQTIDNQSSPLEGESYSLDTIATGAGGDSASVNNPAPDIDNDDLTKSRLRLPRRIGWFERRWTRMRHFWRPPLTPMEEEALEQARHNAAIRRNMIRQMMIANKILPQAYANLGYEYIRNRTKDRYERSKPVRVGFCKWLFSSDGNTIYGKMNRFPYGVNPAALVQDDVLTALTVSMGHPCGGRLDPNGGGVIISVSLAGTMDIDDMFGFNKALDLISESAPPLTYMVGATANGGRKTYDLEAMPHLLIAGTTGSGKSVALRCLAATFIARNAPENVKLLLADLKRVDLAEFEGVPHLIKDIEQIPTGIVTHERQIIPMMKWLEMENNRRQDLFSKQKGIHDLAGWNRKHLFGKLPRIVVIIDEMALVVHRKANSDEFNNLVYDLASTARCVGIHLVVATQFAKSEFITTSIKLNFPGRECFSVPDLQGSICMVETGECVNIYPPPGRGVFVHGVTRCAFQSPFISDGQLKEIVKNAIEGKTSARLAATMELTFEEIVKWSLVENNGFLGARDTFKEFTGRMTWNELVQMLNEMDNKIYSFGEAQYRVVPGNNNRTRQLELVVNNPGTDKPTETPPFSGPCPECGAPRTKTPCEFCGGAKMN